MFPAVFVCSERRRGRLCVALPAGEVEDLQAKLGGEKLPHLLPTVCRSLRGHQAEVPPQLPGHLQGTNTSWFDSLTGMKVHDGGVVRLKISEFSEKDDTLHTFIRELSNK